MLDSTTLTHQHEGGACVAVTNGGVSSSAQGSARVANPMPTTRRRESSEKRPRRLEKSHKEFLTYYGFEVPKGWVIHHKNENHKDDSPENWELMTHAQHTRHHKVGHQVSEESKKKASFAGMGKQNALGYKHSDEARRNMSKAYWAARKRALDKLRVIPTVLVDNPAAGD